MLLWGGIGGYRGNQYYNIDVEKKNYIKHSYITNTACIMAYTFFYMIPPFCVVGILNELYTLENFIKCKYEGKNNR